MNRNTHSSQDVSQHACNYETSVLTAGKICLYILHLLAGKGTADYQYGRSFQRILHSSKAFGVIKSKMILTTEWTT